MASTSNLHSVRLKGLHVVPWIVLALVILSVLWIYGVERGIHYYATHDEAQPAGAIAVFGAAEYDGRPSPVLRARLDHALALYHEGLAPLVITLGGSEIGDAYSEGGVGRDYLIAHGVPETSIIAETESRDTQESVERLSAIAHKNHLDSLIVVSDGAHLFRVHELCASMGLNVYTSPRPELGVPQLGILFRRNAHEVLSYSWWRLRRALGLAD